MVRPGPTTPARTWTVRDGKAQPGHDILAAEEPMEIRLLSGGRRYPAAVTMRTPGADFELAVGFLYNEGIITSPSQLRRVSYCVERDVGEEQRYNIVNVVVGADIGTDAIAPLERHFSMTSACGVCGRSTLDALAKRGYERLPDGPELSAEVLKGLPGSLRRAQRLFEATGGLHAAALFTPTGQLVALREDVGRHNALDKLTGWAFMQGRLPLTGHIVMVSGRSSFELVQKSVSIGASALCSVSAPSSLAVELADEFNLTLVGFLREERFNLYAAPERVLAPARPG